MKHTHAQPASIHPLAIGTWVRSNKTGAVGQVVGIHIRSGCEETPAAISWPHCEHPFFMYDLQIGDGTHFYGPDTLELTEAPMTQDTPNETAPAPAPDIRKVPVRTVHVPAQAEHLGIYSMYVRLEWVCPVCGGARGEPHGTISYDGSRRMNVDGWENPCGHVDSYADVRKEARANGLNPDLTPEPWDLAAAGEASTTAQMADVVAAAVAEVADVVDAADAALAADDARLARVRAQRHRAMSLAHDYHDRWQAATKLYQRMGEHFEGALKSARAHKATIKALRVELEAAQHEVGNKQTIIAFLTADRDARIADNVKLRAEVDAARAELATVRDASANRHAGEVSDASIEAAASDQLAMMREQLNAAKSALHDANFVHQRALEAAQNEVALLNKRLSAMRQKARAEQPAPAETDGSERDEVAALLAVLRQYGYEAYANGKRNDSAAWLAQRLANIGEPVPGGAVKPAAS